MLDYGKTIYSVDYNGFSITLKFVGVVLEIRKDDLSAVYKTERPEFSVTSGWPGLVDEQQHRIFLLKYI